MARKIRPTTRDSAPTVLVTVGAESSAAPWSDAHAGTPHVFDRAHVCVSRRKGDRWGAVSHHPCPGWADVWDVLDGLASGGRRVYVVAPRASDLLTQLHWWDRVERGELSIWERASDRRAGRHQGGDRPRRVRHPLVISGRPDIIGYSLGGCSYRWVSVTNWADLSMLDMAKQVGWTVPESHAETDKWEWSHWPAADVAGMCMAYTQRLILWWLAHGCGVWRDTPGAAAWSSYLRRMGPGGIVVHSDPVALEMENRACFGGRASAFFLGDIGDPDRWGELAGAPQPSRAGFGISGRVHRFDVRAMYPTILRDEWFPTAPLHRQEGISVSRLKAGLASLTAVAAVRLKTQAPRYPHLSRGLSQYPVGAFDTVLTSPELSAALRRGELERVWSVQWYCRGRPFREWAEWVLGLRSAMRANRDTAGEVVVKTLANSLGGRLARRRQGWTDQPSVIPQEWWGEWWVQPVDEPDPILYRSLAGHVQVMHREEHRPGTLGACFAHLTAYGRAMMESVRETCGRREVLWQDTDGVIVTDLGRERLEKSEWYHPDRYGSLRYQGSYTDGRFITAKHYWLDGEWTLAGIHDGFTVDSSMHAHDVVTLNPVRSAISPEQAAVYRAVRHIDLARIDPGVSVGHDGWAIPPQVWRGEPPTAPAAGQLPLWGEES